MDPIYLRRYFNSPQNKCICLLGTLTSYVLNHNWYVHPSMTMLLPLQEYELIRIFDSMSFEDECEDNLQMGIQAQGSLDASQTRQVMCLSSN